ncbi:hypothetical protein LP421_04975 (plasmid) [Rhizobium sp. RCAM05350]|nr:hypothetical protein LP421_04975 [Rhizobium sp. RCAM05350]
MNPVSSQVLLSRMEAARRETRHHLDRIHRQITGRAERVTVTEKAKARSHRRGRSRWTRSDAQQFQDHVARLAFERRTEIAALARKLERQERAIVTMCMTARRLRGQCGGVSPIGWRAFVAAGPSWKGCGLSVARSPPPGFRGHSPAPVGLPFVFAAV